jgi:hypothetical protein
MVPTGKRSIDESQRDWDEHHRSLRAFVEGLDRSGLQRSIFRHPVTGPLTVSQGIAMMEVHLDTHTRQIRNHARALGAKGRTPSTNRSTAPST